MLEITSHGTVNLGCAQDSPCCFFVIAVKENEGRCKPQNLTLALLPLELCLLSVG